MTPRPGGLRPWRNRLRVGPSRWPVTSVALLTALWPCTATQGLQAQTAPDPPSVRWPSQRPLSTGHWSYDFLEALTALGVVGTWSGWFEPRPASSIRESLEAAREGPEGPGAEEPAPSPRGAMDTWGLVLARELGTRPGQPDPRVLVSIGGGYDSGPEGYLEEQEGPFGHVGADVRLSRSLGVWARVSATSGDPAVGLQEGGASLALGPVQVVAGRMRIGLGQGTNRTLLGGRPPMDGVLVASRAPFLLPGVFRYLGPFSFNVFAAPSFENAAGFESWFGSMGLSLSPHPRVQLGAQRTARFAGEGVADWNWGDFWDMLVGRSGDNPFDDSQGEIDVRIRWPLLRLEVTTYASLGFEDLPSIHEDPGIMAGALVPLSTGRGLFVARYEYEAFGKRAMWCGWCEYRTHNWYADREYGTYATEETFVGSDLGGYGSAHRVSLSFWSGWSDRPPVRGEVGVYRDHRLGENRLASLWPGVRKGVEAELFFRPSLAWEVGAKGEVASLGGHRDARAQLLVRLLDARFLAQR